MQTGTKNKEKFTESWTCRSKKPSVGDEFFLIKQGERPRGIIGHGHIVRESYIAPHYDAERAKKGDWPNHVDAEFDWLLNYETEAFLDQDILKSLFPSQQWSPQGSGIRIQEEVAPQLKKLWDNMKSSEGRIPK